jgi:hypothetical protein
MALRASFALRRFFFLCAAFFLLQEKKKESGNAYGSFVFR